MGKWCLHASSFIFDRIIIKVAGNQDRHKSSVEFDFGPNQTTHFGVTCPWVTKLSHFGSWISLKPIGQSWSNFMCSIIGVEEMLHLVLGQIGSKLWFPWQLKPPLSYNGEKRCLHPFSVVFWSDPFYTCIIYMHKVSDEFDFRPDRTTDFGVSCPWGVKNVQ